MSQEVHRREPQELLAGALGPGVPELSCEQCFAELDRYVELTLGSGDPNARVPGMRAHLDGCPACAEDFQSLHDLIAGKGGAP
jgi:hypothetical protein